ncbi:MULTISPECIES: DUF6012 family protein [Pseudomonas]|uniref:Quorum threshold expression element n=2 Tax=Pseudomonas TaxID=286 RepID=A0A2X2CZA9_PSELU|nr:MULTISPECIES: DUF6012 family protein [Pseudomonas]MCG7374221.1 DUF6012 family protein [Pseudomonas luteola]SER40606.1 hypothetical protein SAMN05216409_11968 [Pseudomonas lutea]SPZ05295.1 quorum threshold expression element [Pseudomonas luteola]
MIIHISPTLLTCSQTGPNCSLIDLVIPELGMALWEGKELVTRRPFPNKNYLVACRNSGRKAIKGLLIETTHPIKSFTMLARWSINASYIVKHRVNYEILDDVFDTASSEMLLWGEQSSEKFSFESRWPEMPSDTTPLNTQPKMQVSQASWKRGDFHDVISHGRIMERVENFRMPTIERERLMHSVWDRLPTVDSAFLIEHESGAVIS